MTSRQAKENADELVAKKKDIDAQVIAKRVEAKELEAKMRQKASTAGNIVGTDVPISLTEVRPPALPALRCSTESTPRQTHHLVTPTCSCARLISVGRYRWRIGGYRTGPRDKRKEDLSTHDRRGFVAGPWPVPLPT